MRAGVGFVLRNIAGVAVVADGVVAAAASGLSAGGGVAIMFAIKGW